MHTFKNFKNFADVEIDLDKPMTLLIGRNGSGKSNLIEGVELLAELLKGREVHEISDVERGGRFEIRGSLNGCFKKGCDTFEIGFKDKAIHEQQTIELEFVLQTNLGHRITQNTHYNVAPTPDDFKGVNDLWEKAFAKHDKVYIFDIYPRIMRQYSPIGLKKLSRNGSNISSVLYYLEKYDSNTIDYILELIRKLPEEAFESFEFITTSDNSDVLFALKYPNGEVISAKLLSDGTLRALAILTALETVPEGSRVIIEEIDNGVHASRTKVIIDAIWEASNRRNLKTLITTHNSATLDSLNDEQLECVVVCHYDKQSQSAKLTPFFDLPRVGVLLQKDKLGGLVTRNVIERYLEPDFEKERKKIALESLESCR